LKTEAPSLLELAEVNAEMRYLDAKPGGVSVDISYGHFKVELSIIVLTATTTTTTTTVTTTTITTTKHSTIWNSYLFGYKNFK